MVGIFEGTDALIHEALRLPDSARLKHKSVNDKLRAGSVSESEMAALVRRLDERIRENWKGRAPSQENWRLERQIHLSPKNRSPEVLLERAIASLVEMGGLDGWYNQIPVASGLVDDRADKRAAIDLVHLQTDRAQFVELKWASDTPLYASFEILRYGLAYLFSRDRAKELKYGEKALMSVKRLTLIVLAPSPYFETSDLGTLADGIRTGLDGLCANRSDGLEMTFEFLCFPRVFDLPYGSGADVERQMSEGVGSAANRAVIDALSNLQLAWPDRVS